MRKSVIKLGDMRQWISFFLLLFSQPAWGAITFTGNADTDFPAEACLEDLNLPDVGMPPALSGLRSGFDIRAVCLSYDPANDAFYVGLKTFDDNQRFPIIFGDADGDGDASRTSNTLNNLQGTDLPDLSGGEYVTLAFDFDRDGQWDLVAGVHSANSLNEFAAVEGADNDYQLANSSRFYGLAAAGVTAQLFGFPTAAAPHLEFSITGVSQVPAFVFLDLNDPADGFELYLTAGSTADDGIGEEYFPNSRQTLLLTSEEFKDADGDGTPDARDSDDDDDGISDAVEQDWGEDVPDFDGDGLSDWLDNDADGDKIPDGIEGVEDLDGDGEPNYRDLDSDGDGLGDDAEDADDDGLVGGQESDPRSVDTDADGLCDGAVALESCTGTEVATGTLAWNSDTDADGLCDGSVVVGNCLGSEGNFGTNPLLADTDGDGLLDGQEIRLSRDPLVPDQLPIIDSNDPGDGSPDEGVDATPLGGDVDLTGGPVRLQGSGFNCSLMMQHFEGGVEWQGPFWQSAVSLLWLGLFCCWRRRAR